MPMPGIDTKYITILSQWVVVLKYCYLDLQMNAERRIQDSFS